MVKFLKFLILISMSNILFLNQTVYSIDVIPEGRFVQNHQVISNNPTVQMIFNANHPPVINVTPGRQTIVQFPSEVRSCFSSTNLITLTYGDKVTQNAPQTGSWYSALILNANGDSISKINSTSLLKTPPTNVTCQIRISNSNPKQTESYAWRIIGVKIAPPEETYLVVYLLSEQNQNGQSGLPTQDELMASGESYVDMNKLENFFHETKRQNKKKNKTKNEFQEPEKFQLPRDHKAILTENFNSNKIYSESSLLNTYQFLKSNNRPPSPKLN